MSKYKNISAIEHSHTVCRVVVGKRGGAFKGLAKGLIYMAGWYKQTPLKMLP
jgi:hypothetical protein